MDQQTAPVRGARTRTPVRRSELGRWTVGDPIPDWATRADVVEMVRALKGLHTDERAVAQWPIQAKKLNGIVYLSTKSALDHADAMLEKAPTRRQGG